MFRSMAPPMVYAVYAPGGRVYTPVVAYIHLWFIYKIVHYKAWPLWHVVWCIQRIYDPQPWCFGPVGLAALSISLAVTRGKCS